jgi:hypothetical protein
MSKTAPLINVFKADPSASVVPVEIPGLSLPPVTSALLLNDPMYPHVEGRGTYSIATDERDTDGAARVRYAKGSGNAEARRSVIEKDPRRFTQFGHSSPEHYCFGQTPSQGLSSVTGPRVRGALALPHALGEVINAAVFLEGMMRKERIPSIEAAEARGLTVPEGVVFSPAISDDICQGLSRVNAALHGATEREDLGLKYGLASLRVPAAERLKTRGDVPESKGDFWSRFLNSSQQLAMVGRVLKHQLECGFVSLSTHLQNVYNAPDSLCPHADNSDLVPISEVLHEGEVSRLDRHDLLAGLVMRQLQYLPFNLLRYDDSPEIREVAGNAIGMMLCTVAPNVFSHLERKSFISDFMSTPYKVLSTIANRLIADGLVCSDPQIDWRKLREAHTDVGYDLVSEQMISLALDGALKFSAGLKRVESSGGLRAFKG